MREIASFDGLMIVHAEDAHAIEHAPPRTASSTATSCASRPARRGEPRHRPRDRAGPADRLPGAHPARLQRRRAADDRRAQARRRADHRRDLPALPDLRRRGDPRRRDAVQVLPAHPRGRQPGTAVGRACATAIIDLVVSDHSPSTPDLKRLDTGDFGVAWGGISSLQLGLSAVWTEARQRGFDLVDVVPLDVRGAGRAGRSDVGKGPDRRRLRRRLRASSRPTRPSWSTCTACTTRTPSRRMTDVPLAGSGAQHLAAGQADRHQRRAAGPAPE